MKSVAEMFNQNKIITHPEKATGRQVAPLGVGEDFNLALQCPAAPGQQEWCSSSSLAHVLCGKGEALLSPMCQERQASSKTGERRSQESG